MKFGMRALHKVLGKCEFGVYRLCADGSTSVLTALSIFIKQFGRNSIQMIAAYCCLTFVSFVKIDAGRAAVFMGVKKIKFIHVL